MPASQMEAIHRAAVDAHLEPCSIEVVLAHGDEEQGKEAVELGEPRLDERESIVAGRVREDRCVAERMPAAERVRLLDAVCDAEAPTDRRLLRDARLEVRERRGAVSAVDQPAGLLELSHRAVVTGRHRRRWSNGNLAVGSRSHSGDASPGEEAQAEQADVTRDVTPGAHVSR